MMEYLLKKPEQSRAESIDKNRKVNIFWFDRIDKLL